MPARISNYFILRPYWIAIFISLLLILWMLSSPKAVTLQEESASVKEQILPKVQTTRFIPEKMTKSLTLYGKSEANSRAVIRAEVAGKIAAVTTKKGLRVKTHQALLNIEKNELPFRLAQAQALLDERLLNYKAVKSLNDKGLQGRARLAEMNSLLLAARTDVEQLQLKLARTNITAPFSGILQEQFAEQGDYVQIGDPVFSLENIDPIVIRGDATEHYVSQLTLGQSISATLLSGEVISGKITYIASMADSQSSTFRIEAEFANPELKIFSGISAKLSIPLYPVEAIYISPSALAMDNQGNLGVKLVEQGRVVFKAIKLVEADNNGAWLSGFTGEVDIITLGQGFVKPGDSVQAVAAEK
ncbi:efflux RND transporter periplasmic adaptor subunit [Psychromonas ossibalaenae]|uniref:efflux RND transporter periplasmic adaptor subunit n=1 Tax=Psychromonas ossibalaenae TaxID=444922 RepID=UPI0003607053|nr:efflux RND transporter periplasmic adaptor subunit [Psychromonas ossibalaenae]